MKADASNPSKKCTLQDVAALAQVSVSTVSHVLNNTAKISDATKERVLDAVKKLRYHASPESSGNFFRQNRKTIGVIVQDIKNEFYAACAGSVLSSVDNSLYTVILCDCCYDPQKEANLVHELIYQRVSGLIFFGGANDEDLIGMADGYGIPIVLANRCIDGFSSVMFAHTKAMRELIGRLYGAGRKDFLYLSESPELQSIRDRKDGFCLGMMDNHISDEHYHIVMDKRLQMNKVESAQDVLQEYLDHSGVNFDTVITSSDLIAIGALKFLSKNGYSIPDDIWLVGYDDISVAALVYPSLTTVRQDTCRLGEEAFLLLNEMIQAEGHKPKQIVIENTIVTRKSAKL